MKVQIAVVSLGFLFTGMVRQANGDLGLADAAGQKPQVVYRNGNSVYLKTCRPPVAYPTRDCVSPEAGQSMPYDEYLKRLGAALGIETGPDKTERATFLKASIQRLTAKLQGLSGSEKAELEGRVESFNKELAQIQRSHLEQTVIKNSLAKCAGYLEKGSDLVLDEGEKGYALVSEPFVSKAGLGSFEVAWDIPRGSELYFSRGNLVDQDRKGVPACTLRFYSTPSQLEKGMSFMVHDQKVFSFDNSRVFYIYRSRQPYFYMSCHGADSRDRVSCADVRASFGQYLNVIDCVD